jgi:23S rRNA (adenine2503-C2)-methyltransferase
MSERRFFYSAPMVTKKDIRALSLEQITEYLVESGEQAFRAKQVYEWLWKKGAKRFEDMTNLSLTLREKLADAFVINHIRVDEMQRSSDGTIKNAVRLHDGKIVESVLIPTPKRITACVSSQVGCSLDCHFCATARLKRMRNLNADEIYDQVVAIKNEAETFYNRPLTNIVFMGMGEPLMNYNNVLAAIEKITNIEGLGMSPKRITLSTVGLAKLIKKLADDEVKFNLAVSLHSARDEVRDKIMPINHKNPLSDLLESLQYWYQHTGRKVTFEYVVWKDINDKPEDIRALVEFCKRIPSKVNLIEYNPIDPHPDLDEADAIYGFQQADQHVVEAYVKALTAIGVTATVRHSRGKDIDAACGQLANKNEIA